MKLSCTLVALNLCIIRCKDDMMVKDILLDLKTCFGEGRSSCNSGEVCRKSTCVKVNPMAQGCLDDSYCEEGYECYKNKCIKYADEEAMAWLKQKYDIMVELMHDADGTLKDEF
ncbi:uncharacterized protein LOC111702558 isoform X2 [Eurytemora carolleeae]|uniref:uncharacterized protein LOC111702558 isoform X2 n=1 Tax=Eurytemora carolleeae TaxID=1294199 RepID=UPI000C760CB3|nr:uncharacterized protein LOC111702558 isoform X2 [Eurytemora carolleeae]|eukprot:XP_023330058.1 uncharacterized protein LOC111702558 isoform X2 [Eurytemora affinis]